MSPLFSSQTTLSSADLWLSGFVTLKKGSAFCGVEQNAIWGSTLVQAAFTASVFPVSGFYEGHLPELALGFREIGFDGVELRLLLAGC